MNMTTRIAYYNHTEFTFATIGNVEYVSLRSLHMKNRPPNGLILSVSVLDTYGYTPLEIIKVEDAIELKELKDQTKEFLKGMIQ